MEPLTSRDQATDEHDVIPHTRKRRRLAHKSSVSARLTFDFDEDDAIQVQADCSVPAFAEKLVEKRAGVGTICATGFEGDVLSAAMGTSCQSSGEAKLGRHEHTVQLLEKGGDTTQLPAVSETDGTKTESCQQRKLLVLSAVAEVQRNLSSSGHGQRRKFSSMTQVLSLILAGAQHLDSSCNDCWNRAVRFGRPDLLEVCADSGSPLVEAVESAGEEGLRTSLWNGLYLFYSAKRPRHVWFSSPCRASGASSQRVSRILDGIAAVVPRVRALGCHFHFAQPLSVSSWRQNSLLSMFEKMMKAVVNGCSWGLRESQGSLLSRICQFLTTSHNVQRVFESSNL